MALSLFKKRQSLFITHIHNQAATTLAGLEALVAYFNDQSQESATLLTRKEKEADEFRRILIYELNKTINSSELIIQEIRVEQIKKENKFFSYKSPLMFS